MKKKLNNMLMLVLFFAGFAACKKDKTDDTTQAASSDYRMKYVGTYSFFSYRTNSYMGPTTFGDTLIFTGSISLVPNSDSLIQIKYRPGAQTFVCGTDSVFGAHIEPLVKSTGLLKYPRLYNCSIQSNFTGIFVTADSVMISLTSGSMVSQSGQNIIGRKIK